MNDTRMKRQKAIAALIKDRPISSQDELTAKLAELGYVATQATVSRDLQQLGAVRVRRGGVMRYALGDEAGHADWVESRLERIFAEWVYGVDLAGTIIVLRTPPGSAHVVALAIDQARLAEVAGTIAGDDTLFVAARDEARAAALSSRFHDMSGQ